MFHQLKQLNSDLVALYMCGGCRAGACTVYCVLYLDLTWAVPQGSSLAGGEHGDHFVQASLQRTKHLPCSLLLPTVSHDGQVQRPRPAEMKGCLVH